MRRGACNSCRHSCLRESRQHVRQYLLRGTYSMRYQLPSMVLMMCSQPQSPRILLTGRSKAVERLLRNQRNTKLPKLAISSIRHRYLIAKRHAKRWPVELHEKAETINLMVPFASGVFSSAAVLGNEGWASSLNKLVRKCWLFDETTRACGIPSTTNDYAVAYGYAAPSILQRSDCSPDSLMLWYRYNVPLLAFGREHPRPKSRQRKSGIKKLQVT